MKLKKMLALLIALVMVLSLVACTSVTPDEPDDVSDAPSDTTESSTNEEDGEDENSESQGFVLNYPESMVEQGYETLSLDYVPERIACMSSAQVYVLYEMGASIVAAVSSDDYPEGFEYTDIGAVAHSDDFDIEIVVAQEPDLVIMSASYIDSHGATLEDLGIPVYYVSAGHTVSYNAVKAETQCFVDAFSVDEETTANGVAIMQSFADLEARLEDVAAIYDGMTVMVLQSGSTTMHYIQTAAGTLASMADMMGFTNVYENEDSSMALIDMEQALSYDPDLILVVGAYDTSEGLEEMMNEAYEENPDYWYSINAVSNGDVIYLPMDYIATSGIGVVDLIDDLIDIIAAHYAAEE